MRDMQTLTQEGTDERVLALHKLLPWREACH